jgi:hypothetical protein
MPKKEAPLESLANFIPEAAVSKVMDYLRQYKVHLTITRERKSVLGDYRHATHVQNHRISVNGSLNKYAFLITLVHELAHLVTFEQFGHRVQPHGREWKNLYAILLRDFILLSIFPEDITLALKNSLHDLPASSCSDENLMRILKKYDARNGVMKLVEELKEGDYFVISGGRVFQKGHKLRKRFLCTDYHSGKKYLFSPIYEVMPLTKPEQ